MMDAPGHYDCLNAFTTPFKCLYNLLHSFVRDFIREIRKKGTESTKEVSNDNRD
jgi:hypothetical protein